MSRSRILALAAVVVVVALAPACGGHSSTTTDIVEAGQVDIKLPPGWKVVDGKAVRPGSGAANASGGAPTAAAAGTGDTIPLAKDDPTTAFFKATGAFQSCLTSRGTKFIGAPDQSKPDSPANNPDYVKSLSTCAAQSKIVQALQDMTAAQDKLTPDQIKTQNEQYLKWRTCMIGRGWDVGEPKPDSKGRLFAFSATSQPKIVAPPGKDLLSSSDLRECATQSQKAGK